MLYAVIVGFAVVCILLALHLALLHRMFVELADLGTLASDTTHTVALLEDQLGERARNIISQAAELEDLRSTSTAALVGAHVVANLQDGTSIRGVLTDDHPQVVVLDHAEYLSGQQPEAFAGKAVIPRTSLLWAQALEADR